MKVKFMQAPHYMIGIMHQSIPLTVKERYEIFLIMANSNLVTEHKKTAFWLPIHHNVEILFYGSKTSEQASREEYHGQLYQSTKSN